MSGTGMYADFTDEENNGIAWDEENAAAAAAATATTTQDQVVIGYDTTNESFFSAIDDTNNTTQYFSVMETSTKTMLGDMSAAITLDADNNAKGSTDFIDAGCLEGDMMANTSGNDIMLYDVPGDGLYGIQLAEDEAGNLQKYQFKLR